ncbi:MULTISPECIES: MFS transporter [Pseudoxanthomonas]|uniref:MFS family permease n=1 Tax=Pseudoxanthomonas winnipegensis TaxID=2480810 RepID=A0AAW8GE63_9GAMM|nr:MULTISPECIES: MFS transporter [Pseudoxanthomonas]MDQ1120470.1 MFS family permease [Pseudoxanthomonas winnipegensis]MDQ1133689.1 MFS family permease [Pseudoxanthomonas winnipegensis]MDR6140070.1 MFS family permease [Pseudoxanthomonas sp. SORGH_AS_0997]
MPAQKFGKGAVAALVIAHCAGMLDLVALPVWVGALVERFGFSPQQAGGLATLFLLGAVAASAVAAHRFNRVNPRVIAASGFAVAALAFLVASTQTDFAPLAVLHLLAGLAAGAALSMVHGTMGHADNPHRLFATAGVAIGLFGILMLGGIPQLLISHGGQAMFQVFAVLMALAAVACALLFRNPTSLQPGAVAPFNRATWLTILGISIMTYNQAMVFSFVEVIGKARGFAPAHVLAVLLTLGIVNFLFPAPLAAFLQNRVRATAVVQIGPAVQAVLALVVTGATAFVFWAPAASVFVAVQIFTHTFAFGLLARLEPSGRAVAATPAMLMIGAALGPIVGGALGEHLGFGALGIAAVLVAALSITCFSKAKAQ